MYIVRRCDCKFRIARGLGPFRLCFCFNNLWTVTVTGFVLTEIMEEAEDEESLCLQNLHTQHMSGTCLKELYKEMWTKYSNKIRYGITLYFHVRVNVVCVIFNKISSSISFNNSK